ncbi:hypothetical protein BDF14DRAFT_1840248 [Spinellus fusiger]|nr:hypothetical protein BDF14DRAFT_1840248 [Spinellus fusiger]
MLTQQQNAWAFYCTVYFALGILLIARSRANSFLIPFILFVAFSIISLLYLLLKTYPTDSDLQTQISSSQVLVYLPVISIALFGGIVQSQLTYLGHITHAAYSRGLPELNDEKQTQKKNKSLASLYYGVLLLYILYIITAILFLWLHLYNPTTTSYRSTAICVTCMMLLVFIDSLIIYHSTRHSTTQHLNNLRRKTRDIQFLRFSAVLFSITIASMTLISWLDYETLTGLLEIPLVASICLETFFVYLPVFALIACCLKQKRMHQLGQQYPSVIQNVRRQTSGSTYRWRTSKEEDEIRFMVGKLGRSAAVKIPSPPSSYARPASVSSLKEKHNFAAY